MKRLSIFLGNFFLPLVWMALTGIFTLGNFVIGFFLSALVLWVTMPRREVIFLVYLVRLFRWLEFILFFLTELFMASLRVVHDILTPRHRMRPAIIAIPLELRRDLEILLLANLITLTPGTLSLEVSPGRDVLYIHAMYVEDVEGFRRMIKEKLETRVRKVMR
jgi:multicomponent Na+:H+ antiporter subunit E